MPNHNKLLYFTTNTEPNFPLPISLPFTKSLSFGGSGGLVLFEVESIRLNVLGASLRELKVDTVEVVYFSYFYFRKADFMAD